MPKNLLKVIRRSILWFWTLINGKSCWKFGITAVLLENDHTRINRRQRHASWKLGGLRKKSSSSSLSPPSRIGIKPSAACCAPSRSFSSSRRIIFFALYLQLPRESQQIHRLLYWCEKRLLHWGAGMYPSSSPSPHCNPTQYSLSLSNSGLRAASHLQAMSVTKRCCW